uniref:Uncharacterized protein n=1 Tax=Picea glauca TaxID=3330 RepID=A0A101M221_PICGL|nr:hypothetical protein ABT39_MTgene2826 [Picea glauca]
MVRALAYLGQGNPLKDLGCVHDHKVSKVRVLKTLHCMHGFMLVT